MVKILLRSLLIWCSGSGSGPVISSVLEQNELLSLLVKFY